MSTRQQNPIISRLLSNYGELLPGTPESILKKSPLLSCNQAFIAK